MLVKIAPLGERVLEVNVEEGTSIREALRIAGVVVNGRSIMLNNEPATEDTTMENDRDDENIVTLASKMKGGK